MDVEPTGFFKQIFDWAAYIVAVLVGLVWKSNKDKLDELRSVLKNTITKADFEKHEEREEKDRDERRQAEAAIRDQVEAANFERRQAETSMRDHLHAVAGDAATKLGSLETKMEGKLDKLDTKIDRIIDRRT